MNSILLAGVIVSSLGLVAGIGLSVASVVFSVKKNQKEEDIRECLPGANCGACGYSGCDGYAAALADGSETKTNLCAPGGSVAAEQIAKVIGVAAEGITKKVAFVHCSGTPENSKLKLNYEGELSCKYANQLFGGPKECVYGCIGYGDCVNACKFDSMYIVDGIARVDYETCKSCGACVKACPKGLIDMLPINKIMAVVSCKNHNKGAFTRKECKVGCIGCMKCQRVCPVGAVKVENFTASVDADKCIGCGKCVEGCPTNAIKLVELRA